MKFQSKIFTLVLGLLFAVPLSGWAAAKGKVLHSFGAANDGSSPNGPIALDSAGRIYGVTIGGPGQDGNGTVFELAPEGNGKWKEAILFSFTAGGGGALPWGNLIFDGQRNLYGTLRGYLSYAVGGVFELSPGSGGWTMNLIYPGFNGNTGPGLARDGKGNLYGAMGEGQYTEGAIAELSPGSNGWNHTALYSFFCGQYGCRDGYDLGAPPIWDGKGNMFGTTAEGGIAQKPCWISFGCGVIFEMTPNGDGTWTYHVLHRFASSKTDGQTPSSGLVMDASGNFYGTTGVGGANNTGTLFKLSFTGGKWKKTVLYDFPYPPNGAGPGGQLAFDKAGNLYGANGGGNTTCNFGQSYCGMIYKLTPQKNGTWKYSSVYKFHGPDGWGPIGVTLDGKGHIYGTTVYGGKYGYGVAFEITP